MFGVYFTIHLLYKCTYITHSIIFFFCFGVIIILTFLSFKWTESHKYHNLSNQNHFDWSFPWDCRIWKVNWMSSAVYMTDNYFVLERKEEKAIQCLHNECPDQFLMEFFSYCLISINHNRRSSSSSSHHCQTLLSLDGRFFFLSCLHLDVSFNKD